MAEKSNFKRGKYHGSREVWYDNGEKLSRTTYVNGKQHGIFDSYDLNGKITNVHIYKHGKLHGLQKEWYYSQFGNKQTLTLSNWKNGIKDGIQELYDYSVTPPKLLEKTNYHDDQKHGTFEQWSKITNDYESRRYHNNVLHGINKYTKRGEEYIDYYYYGTEITQETYNSIISNINTVCDNIKGVSGIVIDYFF